MGKVEAKKLQRSMNPITIQALVENDCDLPPSRPITNVFYSNDPLCKTRIEYELTARGFTVHRMEVTEPTKDEPEYSVDATIIHCVDSAWIDNLTDTCIDLASDCCAEYDGWFTEIA
jgi:regulator of RNase E activity RraB